MGSTAPAHASAPASVWPRTGQPCVSSAVETERTAASYTPATTMSIECLALGPGDVTILLTAPGCDKSPHPNTLSARLAQPRIFLHLTSTRSSSAGSTSFPQ